MLRSFVLWLTCAGQDCVVWCLGVRSSKCCCCCWLGLCWSSLCAPIDSGQITAKAAGDGALPYKAQWPGPVPTPTMLFHDVLSVACSCKLRTYKDTLAVISLPRPQSLPMNRIARSCGWLMCTEQVAEYVFHLIIHHRLSHHHSHLPPPPEHPPNQHVHLRAWRRSSFSWIESVFWERTHTIPTDLHTFPLRALSLSHSLTYSLALRKIDVFSLCVFICFVLPPHRADTHSPD